MTAVVRERLVGLITEITGRSSECAAGEGDLAHAFGLDSIQSVRLINRVEKTFGVVFGRDPEDMKALASLDALSRWIEQHA